MQLWTVCAIWTTECYLVHSCLSGDADPCAEGTDHNRAHGIKNAR